MLGNGSPLILPGSLEFDLTLGALPLTPGHEAIRDKTNGEYGFVVRPGSVLMEAVPLAEFEDYAYGGEYDERLEEMDEDDWE